MTAAVLVFVRVVVTAAVFMLIRMVVTAAVFMLIRVVVTAAVLMFIRMVVRNDLDLRLMFVYDMLDHAVQLLRNMMPGADCQRLCCQIHRCRRNMLNRGDFLLNFF